MADVTRVRWYVRGEVLTPDDRAVMYEVRADFFDRPHYPASTMVGVPELVHEDALVELQVEAELPDDGWESTFSAGRVEVTRACRDTTRSFGDSIPVTRG